MFPDAQTRKELRLTLGISPAATYPCKELAKRSFWDWHQFSNNRKRPTVEKSGKVAMSGKLTLSCTDTYMVFLQLLFVLQLKMGC